MKRRNRGRDISSIASIARQTVTHPSSLKETLYDRNGQSSELIECDLNPALGVNVVSVYVLSPLTSAPRV
jgi:hypothetical protein